MKIAILIIINITFMYANKVFDISQSDYKEYLNNKEKMILVFKDKFLENKNNIKNENKIVTIVKDDNTKSDSTIKNNDELLKLEASYLELLEKNKILNAKLNKKDSAIKDKNKQEDKDMFHTVFINSNLKKKQTVKVENDNFNMQSNVKKDKSDIKSYIKMLKIFNEEELLDNLTIENVMKDENIVIFIRSIDKILLAKNIKYEQFEIKKILELINKRSLSSFESNLYLTQIKELIKG